MKEKRDSSIELLRFLASMFIVCGHMYYIELGDVRRPFADSWYYVEFFLILSGFFTAKRFSSEEKPGIDRAVNYTWRKYRAYLPMVIPAIVIFYIINCMKFKGDLISRIQTFENMPYEAMLLSSANTDGTLLFPLWYISATFLVSPFVCLISQIKNKYLKGSIAFYLSVFFYLNTYDFGSHNFPNQLIRAFCGMMLGVLAYTICEQIKSKQLSIKKRWMLTILWFICYVFPLLTGFLNIRLLRFVLICFFFTVILVFTDQLMIKKTDIPFFRYLGKLSLPIYIWHPVVGQVIKPFIRNCSEHVQMLLFFGTTILVAIVSVWIINMFFRPKECRKMKS